MVLTRNFPGANQPDGCFLEKELFAQINERRCQLTGDQCLWNIKLRHDITQKFWQRPVQIVKNSTCIVLFFSTILMSGKREIVAITANGSFFNSGVKAPNKDVRVGGVWKSPRKFEEVRGGDGTASEEATTAYHWLPRKFEEGTSSEKGRPPPHTTGLPACMPSQWRSLKFNQKPLK